MADATRRVAVQLQADTRAYQQKMDAALGPRSPLGKLGVMAAGATAAAGAAIVAFAGKSVTEFASLERGMNEVFTLMPDISGDAMTTMTDDVQAFARELGVLPNEIVPALYDSISAGVPRENVFAFLETANALAVGGVSDLNTAVDGLTSATNAYGTDLLSAAEAADIMFTGVRLGKTTIDELSATVSETAPIAASLGVGFDETTAALAAMTAQGEPSQKAATKLRQLMAELSDSGSAVSKEFAKISGESFPDFIAGGGTLQEALVMIADKAESSGGRVGDSFGSIEAAMAATMLTSDTGRETMNANMDAMQDSAGATDAAFERMDQGIARTWERMRASLSSFMSDLGERLGPGVSNILGRSLERFNGFADETLAFLDRIMGDWDGTWESIGVETDSTVGKLLALGTSLWEGITAAFDLIVAAWETVLKPMWEAIAPAVEMNLNTVLNVAGGVLDLITGLFETLADLLRGDFSGAWKAARDTAVSVFTRIKDQADIWWTGISGTFNALVTFVNTTLDTMFGDLFRMADTSFFDIQTAATQWWTGVKATLNSFISFVATPFQSAWTGMRDATKVVMDTVRTNVSSWGDALEARFGRVKDYFGGAFKQGIEATRDSLTGTFEDLRERVTDSMESLFGGFGDIAQGGMEAVRDAFQWMSGAVQTIWEGMTTAIGNLASGLGETVRSAFGNVVEWLVDQVNAVIDNINDMIDRINDALEVHIPGVGGGSVTIPNPFGDDWEVGIPQIGPWNIDPPDIGNIPRLADGGVVDSATLALIGEAGPEAVVPLDRLGSMGGGGQTIIVELDGRQIMRSVAPRLVDELRLKTGLSGL